MFFSTKRDCEFIVYSLKSALNLNSSTLNTIKNIIKSKQYPIKIIHLIQDVQLFYIINRRIKFGRR